MQDTVKYQELKPSRSGPVVYSAVLASTNACEHIYK